MRRRYGRVGGRRDDGEGRRKCVDPRSPSTATKERKTAREDARRTTTSVDVWRDDYVSFVETLVRMTKIEKRRIRANHQFLPLGGSSPSMTAFRLVGGSSMCIIKKLNPNYVEVVSPPSPPPPSHAKSFQKQNISTIVSMPPL